MLRVVLDTNVLVSAFLYNGLPLDILDFADAGVFELYTSEDALSELLDVLSRPKFRARLRSLNLTPKMIVTAYRDSANVIVPAALPGICSDRADDGFIAIGIAADADVIISGDRHLLGCAAGSPIPVATVAEFLQSLKDFLQDTQE